MKDQLQSKELKQNPVQEDKKVEEEILNRNIKLMISDLLNGQSINKQFKDLKPGITLNKNDLENLSLKDMWKISLSKRRTNVILRNSKINSKSIINIDIDI